MKTFSFFHHLMLLSLLVSACANKGSTISTGTSPSQSTQSNTNTNTNTNTLAGTTPPVLTTTTNGDVFQVIFTHSFVPGNASSAKTFTFPSQIATDILEKSAVIVYIKSADFPSIWYPVPGGISSSDNDPSDVFRYFLNPSQRSISIFRESGDNVTQITATRVIIIPSSINVAP